MADVKTSSFLSINWRDAGIAGIISLATVFLSTGGSVIKDWLNTPTFHFDWVALIIPIKNGIYAGLAVIGQRLLAGNKIVLTNVSKEDVAAVKAGDASVNLETK